MPDGVFVVMCLGLPSFSGFRPPAVALEDSDCRIDLTKPRIVPFRTVPDGDDEVQMRPNVGSRCQILAEGCPVGVATCWSVHA